MSYRILITKNKKRKKVLYEPKKKKTALKWYHKYIEENNIFFPVKYNYGKEKCKFEILLLKKKDSDEPQKVKYERDEFGRLQKVKTKSNKWEILRKNEYNYEEKFKVYRFDKKLTAKEIISKILFKDIDKENYTKQVFTVQNKMIIEDVDGRIDLVVCKNKTDALRLHDRLQSYSYYTDKLGSIFFFGHSDKDIKKKFYPRIEEQLGVTREFLYRVDTFN